VTNSRALLFSTLLLLYGWSSCSPTDTEEADITTSFFIQLEEGHPAYEHRKIVQRVAGWAAERDPVGSELLIIKDGRPIFRGNWGEMDRERIDPWRKNTICRLRSLSNPILATAVLMLQKSGKLELEDPISKYLPEFAENRWGRITIAELLSHTAGLSNIGSPKLLQESETLCAYVDALAATETRPNRDRSQRFAEDDFNLIACLITRVSGMPLQQFLKKRIFQPLGMRDTYTTFNTDVPWRERLASTYSLSATGLGFRRINNNETNPSVPYFHASRGVFSTALDYARFIRLWMNGGMVDGKQLLSPKEIQLGHRIPNGMSSLPGVFSHAWELFGGQPLEPRIPPPFGHIGADESVVLASPEKGLVFIYLTQSRGGKTAAMFAEQVSEYLRTKTP